MQQLEVLAFGETMVRITPPGFDRLEQSSSAELHVGGSESNTLVGLARLGHRVGWFSSLTENPLGRLIRNTLRAHGVDTSHVHWTDDHRVGTYYMERGKPPRSSEVFYDRAASAVAQMKPAELPSTLVENYQPKWFHTSGITLGISEAGLETTFELGRRCQLAGAKLSFDVNYRARLWNAQTAAEHCNRYASMADLVFLPRRDLSLFGVAFDQANAGNGETPQHMKSLRALWPKAVIVLTMGADGAQAYDLDGNCFQQPALPTIEVERLGSGDAFSAGFLSALLSGKAIPRALEIGNVAAAIKYTIPGDLPVWDRSMFDAADAKASGQGGVQR